MFWRAFSSQAELIDGLKEEGRLHVPTVIRAFEQVRLPLFVPQIPGLPNPDVFHDRPIKVGPVHISAPHMYAMVLEAFNLQPGMSLLIVGSGSGYMCALCSVMIGATGVIHGVELNAEVVEHAKRCHVKFREEYPKPEELCLCEFVAGDGLALNESHMKYDRIYVAAGAEETDAEFFREFLTPGGMLIGPFGDQLLRVTRVSGKEYENEELGPVGFAPLNRPSNVPPFCFSSPVWTPETRAQFLPSFTSTVSYLRILQRRPLPLGGGFSALPPSLLFHMLSYCARDWFAVPYTERCQQCGTWAPFRCTSCRAVKYCSRKCQRADWTTHKESCNKQQKRE